MRLDSLIEFLKTKADFRPSPEPLHILDVNFSFDAVLVGPNEQQGLVIVHQLKNPSIGPILRKLQAFSIALERTESTRTVTLILINCDVSQVDFSELSKLCRVLVVPENAAFEDSLGSLLPLELPAPISSTDSAETALKKELGDSLADPLIARLLKAARHSETEVQKQMRATIEEISKLPQLP